MCNSIYTAKVIILLLFYFLHTLLPSTTYKSNVYVSWIKSFFSHDGYLTTSIVQMYVHTSSKSKLIYCQLSLSIEFLHELTFISKNYLLQLTFFIYQLYLTIFINLLSSLAQLRATFKTFLLNQEGRKGCSTQIRMRMTNNNKLEVIALFWHNQPWKYPKQKF